MRQLEEAQAGSSDLQSQLDRLQQSLHSQQQFVISLEATIAGTNPGDMQQAAEFQKQHDQVQQQTQAAEQQLEAAFTGKAESEQQLPLAQQGLDRAAATLAGSVIIPLELFEYDAAYHGAMVRAFGGCVIAQDDATAGQLVTQHGLLCITLDGKISRPGSMQGGWRGQAQGSTGPIAKKVKADQLQVAATAASSRLQEAAAAAQKMQHQLASLEASLAAFAEAQQEVSLLQQEVSALSKAAAANEQCYIQSKRAVADLHERLKQNQQLVDACACTDGSSVVKMEHLQDRLTAARRKASALLQTQEDLAAKADEASDRKQKDQVESELQSLLSHVPELRHMMTRCQLQETNQPVFTDAAGHARQLRQMRSKCKKLKEERSSSKVQQMPAHEQVVQTDEAVFEAVQDKFVALTANLLPKLELRTERVAQKVHQGLQFMYRSNSDKMGGWHCDLSRLSGGERTLVSLALILAAATAGAKSSLFLMDEVDAALDESNQALVATLIKEIMAQSRGCQILCVTHNLAFQQICSSIIQVAKDKHGATIVLDSGSGS
ncbi:hypothetical protein WJX79_009327 [Trebouxia sp. C0005]